LLQKVYTFYVELHIKNADFLEKKTSVDYNFTIKQKLKILKNKISRKNY